MKILTIDPALPVPIGGDTTIIQGENLATQIEFTVPEDMIDLGIIFKFRPYRHEAIITEPLEVIEGVVSYMITNAVTANAGYLDFEVNGYDESLRLVKTLIYHFTVNCSIDGSGEVMPEAYVPWATIVAGQIVTATEKAAEASESASTAFTQAGLASDSALEAKGYRDTAESHATTATTKAGEASGFALSASGSAQTASQKAQEAIDTLANKPDKSYVDAQDALKADKTTLDTLTAQVPAATGLTTVANKNQYYPIAENNLGAVVGQHQLNVWNGSAWVESNGYGMGASALASNTGTQSNGFGNSALTSNTGGASNGFGYSALSSNTGAYSNGFGGFALSNNTGTQSNGFGGSALSSNTGA